MGGLDLKKSFLAILILIISFALCISSVEAQTYRRGMVKQAVTIKKDSNGSANLPNDRGYAMTLYAPEAVEILAEEGNYYLIKFIYSGFIYSGYVLKSCVNSYEYTIDENYKTELINKGFPKDYAEKLAILHAIHPNWVFTPSFTGKVAGGMDFNTAVKGEASVIDRNLIQSSNTSLRSTAPGSYANGVWKEFSGGGWYAASEQTIAYYLDPRNFMNESNFFMFENQGYNAQVNYKPMIEKALSGTFMMSAERNPFMCAEGANRCTIGMHYYPETFIDAGAKNGVNPINLASRVKLEQGNGSSPLALGNGVGPQDNKQYVGYYNFFNINANGATSNDVITNGLKYAYSRGWNNQYVSIVEGASLIGGSYVGVGQSTVYYQKFNTINLIYSHQYMQNIMAPYTEGYDTYVSYYKTFANIQEWDNATYEFLIPVYQNMPTMTSLDVNFNSDATLKTLSVSDCNMNPTFESGIKTYDCYTKKDTKEVTVLAASTNVNAKVEYQEKVALNSDETSLQIKVTAGNGNVEIYEIKIHRIEMDGYTPQEILNGIGIKVTGEFANNFVNTNATVSGIITAITGSYHFAEVKITDANGTVKQSEDHMKTGDIITVTNSGVTTSYKAVVYGDISGDGLIDIRDLLFTQQHIVKARTLANEYLRASDLNKDGLVDIRDLLLLKKYIEGQYQISQE